jgi:2-dehydro-3-deoxyphosphooctonate aldolase (KDO 8-P synthase)
MMQLCGRPVGKDQPIFFIAGPCVIESEAMTLGIAEALREIAERLGVLVIFKASFDKANRSSGASFRGPGMEDGLRILAKVRDMTGLPVLTDVHTVEQVRPVADVVDVLQTPAFLARQTDLIEAVAASGKPANIKKGQFMAPGDMANVVEKARQAARTAGVSEDCVLLCERGSSFGYNNLVSDMRSLPIMARTGCPVVFDATHSVQLPGSKGGSSGGEREFVPVLARAAVAAGIAGVFMETHPEPGKALSDGANAWPLGEMQQLCYKLLQIDACAKGGGSSNGDYRA